MGSGFQSQTRAPQINYATEGVQPPTALAVTTNDNLVIKVHNSNAAPGLRVFVRLLLPDGTIAPNDYTVTPDATRAVNTFSFPLDEGFILSAVVFSTASNVFRGQCYVRLLIFRGSLTQQFVGHMLCEGYVTTATAIGFPVGPQEYAFSGRGVIRSITGTVPAAGAEIAETVPTGAIWRLNTLLFQLNTSAAVGNRSSQLRLVIGGLVFCLQLAAVSVGAGGIIVWNFTPTMFERATSAGIVAEYLGFAGFLPAGSVFGTSTINLDVGDQYTAPRYLVEEWIQP